MAAVSSSGDTVSLYDCNPAKLGLEKTVRDTTRYANAKVVMLGDSGVGKSGLSHQLVHGCYEKTDSTHARRAHVLSRELVDMPDGGRVQREILLWDLAGQPAYRLVHQLAMEGATVACVLCDARRETQPLEAAAYWAQVLRQSESFANTQKFLVAARIDVGGLPASPERMRQFADEQGFSRFLATSALSGEGCEDLRTAIEQAIDWDRVPPVVSNERLMALRKFVAGLKGESEPGQEPTPPKELLLTVEELRRRFEAHWGDAVALPEFISYLERLEHTDVIDLLVFHSAGEAISAETQVLLDPTRVDAYASALLVAAKDEPDGPGHLEEERVLKGRFKLEKRERLPDRKSEKLVLGYVIEFLMQRDLALRETIQGKDYLVFPAQCTTELRYPDQDAFGVAFEFSGAIRNIYATLIAQFAHYEGFSKREFFHDAARYRPDKGGRCVVRLDDHGDGTAELRVSFDAKTPAEVRQGFLEFISEHLRQRTAPDSIRERHACHCAHCHEPIDDRAVKARAAQKKRTLICSFCGETTPLVDLLAAPNEAGLNVAKQMQADAKAGRQRITAAWVIKAKEQQGRYDVFLSHNSKDKKEVEEIAKRLKAKGIRPWLDKWDLIPGDTIQDALEKAIKTIPCAVLFFGKADLGKWHVQEVRVYIEKWANGASRMIPAVLPGVEEMPEMPIWVRQNLWADLRDWKEPESDAFYRLVCGIVNRRPGSVGRTNFTAGEVAEWAGLDR
ncbi:MAG TPA: TIR domain-containing protein [Prosthecobacter sp.]|nr:TIR domain-containing protein [Prosthecobacter sp.]